MTTAQDVFENAFVGPRQPRSAAYRAGVLAALEFRFGEVERTRLPYPVGSAEADAWFSGTDEGHALAREQFEKERKHGSAQAFRR